MEKKYDVLILGGGIAGIIFQYNLKKKGQDSFILTKNLYGSAKPENIESQFVSIIPIFPMQKSKIAKTIVRSFHDVDKLRKKYYDVSNVNSKKLRPNSLASKISARYNESIPLILSEKLFGDIVYNSTCKEIQKKINRQYPPSEKVLSDSRLGFKNGLCLYYLFFKKFFEIKYMKCYIEKVDIKKKIVKTSCGYFRYKKLVVTIPLDKFLKIQNFHLNINLILYKIGMKFLVYALSDSEERNDIIYDCNIDSPLYRIFFPKNNTVVVQLSKNAWGCEEKRISKRLKAILDTKRKPLLKKTLYSEYGYPIDVSSNKRKIELFKNFREKDVYFFGRWGQWEYLDIHELNFSMINNLIDQ